MVKCRINIRLLPCRFEASICVSRTRAAWDCTSAESTTCGVAERALGGYRVAEGSHHQAVSRRPTRREAVQSASLSACATRDCFAVLVARLTYVREWLVAVSKCPFIQSVPH